MKILILILICLSCGFSERNTPISFSVDAEGWGGPPEARNQKPYEYYYIKQKANASNIAISKKSAGMMQVTCVNNAATKIKAELVSSLISETLTGATGPEGGPVESPVSVLPFSGKLTGVSIKECKPFATKSDLRGSEWIECECLGYIKIPGGKNSVTGKRLGKEN